ncbi:hypothetical protein PLESTB_001291100 [Pleodorina starrii]|uniref:Uncharacterized protein n=1 Tax=Pleodorina starrii TaxID=330485 RepID=A0A9W6BTH0_9CHLO|nr:hypothetical protein PLESTB_001291100 [Pleodorina starrii]
MEIDETGHIFTGQFHWLRRVISSSPTLTTSAWKSRPSSVSSPPKPTPKRSSSANPSASIPAACPHAVYFEHQSTHRDMLGIVVHHAAPPCPALAAPPPSR